MGVIFFLLIGIFIGIGGLVTAGLTGKWLAERKVHKPIIKVDDVKQLRAELDELHNTVIELRDDLKRFQEVNNETQKNNVLLFPENFDKDKEEGKTVFVKNGEEKSYETVDWRSR